MLTSVKKVCIHHFT